MNVTRVVPRSVVPLVSLTFVALTLGLAFAHVLEIVGKLRLGPNDWLTVQQNLYVAFGPIGGSCEVLAVLFTWLNAWRTRREPPAHRSALAAAIAVSAGLIAWALIVSPMNTVLSGWTPASIPADWTRVRNRWELGHALQAALFAIAFLALANPVRRSPQS
jgi:hypothetical protein